jgi:hypothetical protein
MVFLITSMANQQCDLAKMCGMMRADRLAWTVWR